MIWALGKLGADVEAEWLSVWQQQLMVQLPRASARDVANVWWGLAAIGFCPEGALLQELMSAAGRTVMSGNGQVGKGGIKP